MLNRAKIAAQLHDLADKLFVSRAGQTARAYDEWKKICSDPLFVHKVAAASAPWPIPSWQGTLDAVTNINQNISAYTVLSVDGSQIYPDRHMGPACYVINIGSVLIRYGTQSRIKLDSAPYVFAGDDEETDRVATVDIVNCRREEFELQAGLELSVSLAEHEQPFAFLFDGSLIFWHLDAKDRAIKDLYFSRYCSSLFGLYQAGVTTAGYISYSKSKELVNLLRLSMCDFKPERADLYQAIDTVTDAQLLQMFLPPFCRTTLFSHNGAIAADYPDVLRPYFFYLNVGYEIARVEIPAWIAQDISRVDQLCTILADQTTKGSGYPVCLAEAHEQAVIKGPDREFFYQLLAKVGMQQQYRFSMSRKSLKKRGIGI